MKLIFALILTSCLQVTARGYSQEPRLTLNFKDAPISKVLQTIEHNTDLKFVYADNFFSSRILVSLQVKEMAVTRILQMILEKTGYTFRKDEDLIIIIGNAQHATALPILGTVLNTKGQLLEAVTVAVEGSPLKTVTNAAGSFFLEVETPNVVLIISSVGYVTQRVPFKGIDLKIVLEENVKDLNEVLVVGYGTQKKREITSAITHVAAEDFNKGNISNVAQLLQGKVAGLSISRPGSDPNGEFVLRLRGLSTLGSNAQPLIVIDDQIGADLNAIDPNDIKSIDVLKDGSAAAIYGTRGSAGVIIINTKSGASGGPRISYNGSGTIESAARFTKHMDAAQFKALGTGTDYGANTDWEKAISRTGLSHAHNITLSNGFKGTTYNASVNYRNNEGVAIENGNQQLNGRFNLVQKALQDKLVLNLSITTTKKDAQLGNTAAFKWATIFNPTAPLTTTDPQHNISGGGYFEDPGILDYYNPVAILKQNSNEAQIKRWNINGSGEYEIISGLKLQLHYSQQTTSMYAHTYSPKNAQYGGFQRHGLAGKSDDEAFNQLFESIATYHHTINKWEVNLLGGYSYQDFLNQGYGISAGNFLTDASAENITSALDLQNGLAKATSYKNASRLVAFFGRAGINYDNLAFLQASLRREGSSEFGSNHQWGYFPAVSAGVDVSRFLNATTINNLKVRASYGVTGALPPGPYLSLERITNQGGSYYAGGGNYLQTYATYVNPNPDLKWETKKEIDAGLDFSLFRSRLKGTFDYFNRKTSDLIFDLTVPSPPNLNPTTWKNIGEITNHGFELSLNYDVLAHSRLTWTTAVNYSSYHIVLSKLDESLKNSYVGASSLGSPGFSGLELTRAVAGQPIGILWGLKYRGTDQNGKYLFDDGKGNSVGSDSAKPGVIGSGLPKFEFGWTNTFRYRNFDLNFFLRGSIGHSLVNTYRAFYENPNLHGYNIVTTKYYNPKLKDGPTYSSLFVEKASFIKLDNATFGYTFPVKTGSAKPSTVRSLRVYVSAQNLFTITKYTGVDPEVRYTDVRDDGTTNILAPGVDRRETWVFTRSFTLGLNIGF
ncbi:SusC/RagA family TonB-linked outer membrane protein [Flavitalea flava]